MQRIFRVAAATVFTIGGLLTVPGVAGAVTASGTDPTGDVTTGGTFDITGLNVTLTTSTVTVAVTAAAALPAKTDPSWSSTTATGRSLTVDFGKALGHQGFIMDGGDAEAIGFGLDSDTSCLTATTNVSGSTITFQAPASCFGFPGEVKVSALMQHGDQPENGDLDFAIAPTVTDTFVDSDISSVKAALPGGYYQLGADGGVFAFGDAGFYGSTGNLHLNAPVVGMAVQPAGDGYRFVATDGGVFSYHAGFYGSMGGSHLNAPIVGMATTHSGNGYWLVASDGGIFAYGDAAFYGSMGGSHLNKPIVSMTPTTSGNGYWLVASDGGVFSYGDAAFYGSTGGTRLNSPIVGMARTQGGHGYWLVGRDGGIFSYGDAAFYGSGVDLFDNNVVSVGTNATGTGYYLASSDGLVQNFGSQLDFGDIFRYLDGGELNANIVGFTTHPSGT